MVLAGLGDENGWNWRELKPLEKSEGTIKAENLPMNIKDVKDTIIDEIINCRDCEKNYQITKEELSFYRKHNTSIPRRCSNCRHKDRMKLRSPHFFWDRKCGNCNKNIICTYPKEKPDMVYCKDCYQKEVIDKENETK